MENLLIDRQSLEAYVRLRHSLSRTGLLVFAGLYFTRRKERQGTCSKEASLRGGDLNDFSYYTSFLPTRQSVSMKRGDIVYKLLRGST